MQHYKMTRGLSSRFDSKIVTPMKAQINSPGLSEEIYMNLIRDMKLADEEFEEKMRQKELSKHASSKVRYSSTNINMPSVKMLSNLSSSKNWFRAR
mmetsp:Transcript_1331/g.1750  ORF Transcript_1331/g.1750 Transcript_1331/m.1750 type:complete len:96 (-) Transcript_1331:23-310(-)